MEAEAIRIALNATSMDRDCHSLVKADKNRVSGAINLNSDWPQEFEVVVCDIK